MSSIPPASVSALSPELATAAKPPGRGAKAAREFEAQPHRIVAGVIGKDLCRACPVKALYPAPTITTIWERRLSPKAWPPEEASASPP